MEEVFLIGLGLIWIIFAVVQDLRKREIANWLNFSLVVFALAFRLFFSLFKGEGFDFFYQGFIGFAIFFILGNLFYYGRVFAGGDAKLMIALGAVLPLFSNFPLNFNLFLEFLLFFLVVGAIYGFVFGGVLALKNKKRFKKEFSKQFKKSKKIIYFVVFLSVLFMGLAFFDLLFLYLSILFFVSPYFYVCAKAIDEACMVKKVDTNLLTEGDWLYLNVKIGKKIIEAKWSGLTKYELALLRKNKKNVLIRQGIPFSPVFLISYVCVFLIYFLFGGIKVFF